MLPLVQVVVFVLYLALGVTSKFIARNRTAEPNVIVSKIAAENVCKNHAKLSLQTLLSSAIFRLFACTCRGIFLMVKSEVFKKERISWQRQKGIR